MDRYENVHRQVLVTVDREKLSADTRLSLKTRPAKTKYIRVAGTPAFWTEEKVSQVRIKSELPQGAQRWREQLLYRTIIDGNIKWIAMKSLCSTIVPGRNWEQKAIGHELVYAFCKRPEPDSNLGGYLGTFRPPGLPLVTGRHTLMMQAFLPGTGVILQTPVKYVNLSCQ